MVVFSSPCGKPGVRQRPGRWRLNYCGNKYAGIEAMGLGPPAVWDPVTSEPMIREEEKRKEIGIMHQVTDDNRSRPFGKVQL